MFTKDLKGENDVTGRGDIEGKMQMQTQVRVDECGTMPEAMTMNVFRK
jgi:hypothetical protein